MIRRLELKSNSTKVHESAQCPSPNRGKARHQTHLPAKRGSRCGKSEEVFGGAKQCAFERPNRHNAADYARCGISEVNRAAVLGIIKKYERGGSPLFKRSEIDAAIEAGKWTPTKGKAAKVKEGNPRA